VGGLLLSMGLTSFLTGITEPIEFTFMFLAPALYALHAVLTGLSMAVMDFLQVRHGFGFSAGLFDFVLNYGLSTRGWIILPFGAVYFVGYYLVFRWFIVRFNVPTPGRAEVEQQKPAAVSTPVESKPAPSRSSSAGFVVQLGAFSDAGNADRLAKTVRESRFDVYTEVVTTSGGKRTRVRVGPYPTRAEAEQARDRLKARKLTYGEPDIVRSDER
jgi:hypothetical protein